MHKTFAHSVILTCIALSLSFSTVISQPLIQKMEASELENLFSPDNDTTYLFNFWATWCGPCRAELPYFESLASEYQEHKVKLILISLDFPHTWNQQLPAFLEKNRIMAPVLVVLGRNFQPMFNRIQEGWSGSIPATFMINSEKDIRKFHNGLMSEDQLRAWLELATTNR